MLISPAYAQSFGLGDISGLTQMAPLVLIFVVFYFFLIRPQQRKQKDHRTMLEALRRGDRVVTGGGIIGTVAKVQGDQEVMVEISEGVRVRVLRSTISSVLAKTEPVPAKDADKDDSDTMPENAASAAADDDKTKRKSAMRRLIGGK
jgi:preprotein translocase subunit YajC